MGRQMCQREEGHPNRVRGLSHVLKSLQGAPLPRKGPGQRVVVHPAGHGGATKLRRRQGIMSK